MAVTTEELVALAKEAADLTNVTDYVTDAQWIAWLNAGVLELHRLVANKFKATYFREYDFTIAEGASSLALPSNFWRLTGLDLDPDTVRRREVRPYNFADRNRFRHETMRTVDPELFASDRAYSLVGSSLLRLQPQEVAGGNYRLYYTPKPRLLAAVRSISHDSIDNVVAATNVWSFTNFGLGYPVVIDLGNLVTVAGAANSGNNGTRAVVEVQSAGSAVLDGASFDETFGALVTATVTTCLDSELEPFAEYVWLRAAIKSLNKEESFAQAKALAEQRNLIRADLAEALETDGGGPATIIDTDEDGGSW